MLPIVVLMVLGVLQVALVAGRDLALQHAAREAVRAAAVDADPGAAVAAAHRVVPDARVRVVERGSVGEPVVVELEAVARTDVPIVGPLLPDLDLATRAVMRVER